MVQACLEKSASYRDGYAGMDSQSQTTALSSNRLLRQGSWESQYGFIQCNRATVAEMNRSGKETIGKLSFHEPGP